MFTFIVWFVGIVIVGFLLMMVFGFYLEFLKKDKDESIYSPKNRDKLL